MNHFNRIITSRIIQTILISIVVLLICPQKVWASIPETGNLRVNFTVNPIGIDDKQPRLSWEMRDLDRNEVQTAYQIIVASSEVKILANEGDIWDTGIIQSDASINVIYNGLTVESQKRYFWKVKIWDKDGNESSWSTAAWWETGLLNLEDWGEAKWISYEETSQNLKNYSLEVDFKIVKSAIGVLFGAKDENNFYMWQVNYDASKSTINFKPHKKINGGWNTIADFQITPIIPYSARHNVHRMKIEVTGNTMKTYINEVLIDTRSESTFKYGRFGFRQFEGLEDALFDNLVIKNLDDSSVIYSNDFSQNPPLDFPNCTTVDDQLSVTPEIQLQENNLPELSKSSPLLRKNFETTDKIKSARVYTTARGVYDLYINGKRISEDILNPGWTSYHKRIQYQTFDVTSNLVQGENAIGAVLGDGWFRGNIAWAGTNHYGSSISFLCLLHIEYTNGTTQTVISDPSWKSKYGPILSSDILNGEIYDARKEIEGWSSASFDDSNWSAVAEAEEYNGAIVAQTGPTVQVTDILPTKTITTPRENVYIFDIGQNIAGWVTLKVKGTAGTKVKLRFGEMLNTEGSLYTDNLRTAKATDLYILQGEGDEVFEPRFTFHGFRYVEVTGYPGIPDKDAITGCAIGSATTPAGSFESSSVLVNQLYSNIKWGQKGNFISVPTDCPQRDERLGWMGDAQVFVRTASYNMHVQQFFEKWMRDVNDVQTASGDFGVTAPFQIEGYSAGWSDAGVIIPWTIYKVYGDENILSTCYTSMKQYIGFLKAQANNNLMLSERHGDWLNVNDETAKDLLSTAYYAYSVSLMAKIASVLGNTTDAQSYSTLFEAIKAAYVKAYVTDDGHVKSGSQTAYLLSLHFDLLPTELRDNAAQHLVANIKAHNWHLTTGFLGISYLCPVLSNMGYTDVAYRLLHNETYPSWLYSIKNGATTMWERWNSYTIEDGFGDIGMNSFNHYAYGSVGEWMFQSILGIDADDSIPAFKKIIMKPSPDNSMSYAKGQYQSVYGTIKSSWKLSDGNYRFEITIPANAYAKLYLPVLNSESITENGTPISQLSEIKIIGVEENNTVIEVGSGSYIFEIPVMNKSVYNKEMPDFLTNYPNPTEDSLTKRH